MKIAIPVCNGHVSTVFEAADEVVVIESLPGGRQVRGVESLEGSSRIDRAARLRTLGIDVLICGALSRSMAHRIGAAGIRIVSFVRGPVEDVVDAFRAGRLDGERYCLPGCRAMAEGREIRGCPRQGHRKHTNVEED
jgi:predicted Fe-Mo cluster-binding NifX family protein